MSYSGVAFGLGPGDYVIIQHRVDYKPDLVYTISSVQSGNQSKTMLDPWTSENGDWFYDNTTTLLSYMSISQNRSSSFDLFV